MVPVSRPPGALRRRPATDLPLIEKMKSVLAIKTPASAWRLVWVALAVRALFVGLMALRSNDNFRIGAGRWLRRSSATAATTGGYPPAARREAAPGQQRRREQRHHQQRIGRAPPEGEAIGKSDGLLPEREALVEIIDQHRGRWPQKRRQQCRLEPPRPLRAARVDHRHQHDVRQRDQRFVPLDRERREPLRDDRIAERIVHDDESCDGEPQREGESGTDHAFFASLSSSARQASRSAAKSPAIHQRSTCSSSAPTFGPGLRPSFSASPPLTGSSGAVQLWTSARAARQSPVASTASSRRSV